MVGVIWSELFPTKLTVTIFIAYISLFISQGILVTASQDQSNNYKYNTVSVVLFTEVLKLVISIVLYLKGNSTSALVYDVVKSKNVLLLYFVPAFLYCIYNNLSFINLSKFDPTTYYLLLQFRVVITGVLFQIIFHKILSRRQWFSLILLTIGCMIKQINFNSANKSNEIQHQASSANGSHLDSMNLSKKNTTGFDLSIDAVFILIQLVCSCLAGVYNEYLLKGTGAHINIYIQNVYMYLDSIVCNVVLLILQGDLLSAFNFDSLKFVFTFKVIIIMINNAAIGIITSFFLKYLNSILKTFASALELLFTAVLCYLLFQIPVYLNTILSIAVVSFSIYLYSLSPVVNTDFKKNSSLDREQNVRLLTETEEV